MWAPRTRLSTQHPWRIRSRCINETIPDCIELLAQLDDIIIYLFVHPNFWFVHFLIVFMNKSKKSYHVVSVFVFRAEILCVPPWRTSARCPWGSSWAPWSPWPLPSPQRLERKHTLNITGIAHLEVRLQTLARCEYRPEMFCNFLGNFKLNYFQKNF